MTKFRSIFIMPGVRWNAAFGLLVAVLACFSVRYGWDRPGYIWGDVIIDGKVIKFSRTEEGVIVIRGNDDLDFIRGMGYAHAHDRLVQMMLQRAVGNGKLSEVNASPESLKIDKLFKRMNFSGRAAKILKTSSQIQLENLEAYSKGINHYIESQYFLGLEFLVSGLSAEEWTAEDTLVTAQLISYAGLTTMQTDAENFIIQTLQEGSEKASRYLSDLFPGQLQGLNEEMISAIKKIRECSGILSMEKFKGIPFLHEQVGSNNWVVSGKHAQHGFPLQANDPHLQIDRLPAIFHEFVYIQNDLYASGVSLPGIPGFVMGRTNFLSFGFTYGTMDQIDYFIEYVENGSVKRPHGVTTQLIHRVDEIHQGKDTTKSISFHSFTTEDDCILQLEGSYEHASLIPDGYYLSFKWAWDAIDGERMVEFTPHLNHRTVEGLATSLRKGVVSCNYLIGDVEGNIAYQQSGALPLRSSNYSMILPIPAWWPGAVWSSVVDPKELISSINPPEGFIATANNDISIIDTSNPIKTVSIHMGPYRQQRAAEMIKAKINAQELISVDYMKEMQLDVFSTRAEKLLPFILPHLPNSLYAEELKAWDLTYKSNSRGALLCDLLLYRILGSMAGKVIDNNEAGLYLLTNTTMKRVIYHHFDNVLATADPASSLWYGEEGRGGFIKRIANEILSNNTKNVFVRDRSHTYGSVLMPITYKNLFWHKITSLFSPGPFVQEGNAFVLMMGDHRKQDDKEWNSAAAWRYVTDLSTHATHTILPGGSSGSWWSTNYKNDLEIYLQNGFKTIELGTMIKETE